MNGFLVRSVVSVICMAGVSGLIAEEEVSSPMSKQAESQLVNPWENPEKFRELLQENKQAILQSKYFKENTYCPALLDEIISNNIEYIKPVKKLDSNDALKAYVENKYGCKDFSLETDTYQAGPSHALQYDAEPPYLVYDITENGKRKYFSVFPAGYQNHGAPETVQVDYEGESSLGHRIYDAMDQCKPKGGSRIEKVSSMYPLSFGGILKSNLQGYLSYSISIHRGVDIEINMVDMLRGRGKPKTYCVASGIELGEKK